MRGIYLCTLQRKYIRRREKGGRRGRKRESIREIVNSSMKTLICVQEAVCNGENSTTGLTFLVFTEMCGLKRKINHFIICKSDKTT